MAVLVITDYYFFKANLDPDHLKHCSVTDLLFMSKLIERVVLAQLLVHLRTNKLENKIQLTYRTRHSSETALLYVVNNLLIASDSKQVSLLSLPDLCTAFETPDLKITLMQHLSVT